jgi:hypothetical protein
MPACYPNTSKGPEVEDDVVDGNVFAPSGDHKVVVIVGPGCERDDAGVAKVRVCDEPEIQAAGRRADAVRVAECNLANRHRAVGRFHW